jgi:copper chaperone
MIAFEVKDMTCGHCVSTITKALKAADKDAKVRIDLASHRVEVEPAAADAHDIAEAGGRHALIRSHRPRPFAPRAPW